MKLVYNSWTLQSNDESSDEEDEEISDEDEDDFMLKHKLPVPSSVLVIEDKVHARGLSRRDSGYFNDGKFKPAVIRRLDSVDEKPATLESATTKSLTSTKFLASAKSLATTKSITSSIAAPVASKPVKQNNDTKKRMSGDFSFLKRSAKKNTSDLDLKRSKSFSFFSHVFRKKIDTLPEPRAVPTPPLEEPTCESDASSSDSASSYKLELPPHEFNNEEFAFDRQVFIVSSERLIDGVWNDLSEKSRLERTTLEGTFDDLFDMDFSIKV